MKIITFSHISKTAGTSIEKSALQNNIKWGKNAFEEIWKDILKDCEYNFSKDSAHHIPVSFCKSEELKNYIFSKYDFFTVVRNPYERCVSEYFCNYNQDKLTPANSKHVNDYIKENIYNLSKNKYRSDAHFIQQNKYCYSKKILKFEKLQNNFDNYMISKNISIRLNNIENKSIKNKISLFDDTILLIQKIYYKDFELFNYNFNPPNYVKMI
jgi:hypothetical protein